MLLQTNSYVVPKERRAEHARLLTRFRQTLAKVGCDDFEVFEQSGTNWTGNETSGRYVQMIRFRDRKHHMEVQAAERTDPMAQKVIADFCELINFPYQQQQGLFAVGFYTSVFAGRMQRSPVPQAHPPDMPEAGAGSTPLTTTAAAVTTDAAMAAVPADPATEIFDEGIEEESGIAGRIGPTSTPPSHEDFNADDIHEVADVELEPDVSPDGNTIADAQVDEIDLALDLSDSKVEDVRR